MRGAPASSVLPLATRRPLSGDTVRSCRFAVLRTTCELAAVRETNESAIVALAMSRTSSVLAHIVLLAGATSGCVSGVDGADDSSSDKGTGSASGGSGAEAPLDPEVTTKMDRGWSGPTRFAAS